MANPQPEKGFVKLANEIWNEIIRRDFSKRQKDIILFIWRLSYGCQKKMALIPKLKDFEICGIGAQNIRKELDYLASCRVITWEKSASIFSVNKDYDKWQISPVRGWDDDRFRELISENLGAQTSQIEKKATSQIKKFSPSKLNIKLLSTSQNKKLRLLKTRSYNFLKQEVQLPSNPCGCRRKQLSKDIIKDIIKDKKDIEYDISSRSVSKSESFYSAHSRLFHRDLTPWQMQKLAVFIDQDGIEESVVIHALERMKKKADNYNLNFAISTLETYFKSGATTLDKAKLVDTEFDERKNAKFGGNRSGGGFSNKPAIEIVKESQQTQSVTADELEELRRLARKLDGKETEPVPF
ncbi:replication protein [Paenibacillus sp. LHD-117]|uniref:replication protein n=1 Tax=Paenibacillus sp. LHD-117 TaxID=3071412 RepID=UPI0027E048E3|nr:replication protein [Paenibacillus sp. LHD-117]MDQ6418695.1 replication protein [Paenibacillus sp. LHD-117]